MYLKINKLGPNSRNDEVDEFVDCRVAAMDAWEYFEDVCFVVLILIFLMISNLIPNVG